MSNDPSEIDRNTESPTTKRMFSEANLRAFHAGLSEAIRLAQAKRKVDPGPEDLVQFMTGAGLLVVVTWDQGSSVLHISLRQQLRATTHATASHFGQFAFAMLAGNEMQLETTPYFTDSRVHHFRLRCRSNDELKFRDYQTAHASFVARYQPMAFAYASLDHSPYEL